MSARLIHLLRHGPPVRSGLLLGHVDEPPALADCPAMRAIIAGLPLRRIVTSDLARCAAQAGHLAKRRELPLEHDPRWRELDFGDWDGLAPEEAPDAQMSRFWDDPDGCPPPGGERWSQLCARVSAALAPLETGTLVVTHAGAIRAAISALTGLDHRGVWALALPYRALVSLCVWPGEPVSGQIVGLRTEQDQ